MSQSKISFKKILRTWLPVFFWSLVLYLIFQSVIFHKLSIKGLVGAVLPITFNQYWFVTVYFFMYCSIPFLNPVVESLNTKKRKQYFLTLALVLIVAHTHYVFGNTGLIGSNLLSFYVMYCIGGLFRKDRIFENQKDIKFIKLVTALIFISQVYLILLFVMVGSKYQMPRLLFLAEKIAVNPSFLFVISDAVGLFAWIGSSRIDYHPLINQLASATFGIYLISDNSLVRNWLWNQLLGMHTIIHKGILIIAGYTLVMSLLVFISCGLIEKLRQIIFKKVFPKL